MQVPALVLFTRELRLDVRRKRSHLLRLAFVVLIFLALATAGAVSGTAGAPGLELFVPITLLSFAALTLAGFGWFATAITQDKEEGTFDLLKLAGISAAGLLLGRSATRLVSVLLILAVQIPFMFLTVTLGGVLPQQVLGMYASLGAYAVFLASLGLLCSVVARTSAAASGLAAFLIAIVLAGPAMLFTVSAWLQSGGALQSAGETLGDLAANLQEASIITRIQELTGARFSRRISSPDVRAHLIGSVVLFGISWWGLGRITRAARRRRSLAWSRAAARRSRRVWRRALLWKELHHGLGGPAVQLAKSAAFLATPVVIALISEEIRYAFSEDVATLLLILVAAEASLYAAIVFRGDVENKTLPQLAVLPLSISLVVAAKWSAVLIALLPGIGGFLVATAVAPDGFANLGDSLADPAAWAFILQFLVFLNVTAYLSLFVKWGALPLAFVIVFASTYLFGLCCMLPVLVLATGPARGGGVLRWTGFLAPMIVLAAVIIVGLQLAIATRLRTLAGR